MKLSTIWQNSCHSVHMYLIWSQILQISIWSVFVLISSKFKLTFSKPCIIDSKKTQMLNIFQRLSMPECPLSISSIKKQTSISVFVNWTNKQFPEKFKKLSLTIWLLQSLMKEARHLFWVEKITWWSYNLQENKYKTLRKLLELLKYGPKTEESVQTEWDI